MREFNIYLEHILEASKLINSFVENITKEEFCNNELIHSAVIQKFLVIGEAVKNIPINYRNNHPEVEWKKAAGMRDMLVHGYYETNYEKLWNTIQKSLPVFQRQIEKLLLDR